MNEDLKTIKELGMVDEAKIIVSLKTINEIADQQMMEESLLENEQYLNEQAENILACIGIDIALDVIKLALKKCQMNQDEAFMMLTDEATVIDLQEEIRKL